MTLTLQLLDSITDARQRSAGKLVISGSHGGLYPAAVASRAAVAAVIFNDAGMGCDNAGVGGVQALGTVGMAAAAVDCSSAAIGSAQDMLDNGIISFVNQPAALLGLCSGSSVRDACDRLITATAPEKFLPAVEEARWDQTVKGLSHTVVCVDSASLVKPEDAQRIVITGSHGGLIGGDPSRALKAQAALAVFNDAGGGKNNAGLSRLPALDDKGVPALTLDCYSAMIGSARSALDTGVVSQTNSLASRCGIKIGDTLLNAIGKISDN